MYIAIQLMDLNLEKILVATNEAATLATYTHARTRGPPRTVQIQDSPNLTKDSRFELRFKGFQIFLNIMKYF